VQSATAPEYPEYIVRTRTKPLPARPPGSHHQSRREKSHDPAEQ
jgi:hypothetical protein